MVFKLYPMMIISAGEFSWIFSFAVSPDPDTGKNSIYLADLDGKKTRQVTLSGNEVQEIIDSPVFSADGQSLLFSAPAPAQPTARTWLDQLLGVSVAEAHNVSSEWWQVPIAGGNAVQLTHIQAPGLFADLSPDKRHFACFTSTSLFVMNTDASGLILIVDNLGGSMVR
jgi:Tol biopolymer transport system component